MHNEKRTSRTKEAMIQVITGCLYGGSNTIVGHPFDTVKTKMQAQAKHMVGEGGGPSYIATVKRVWADEGFLGFYRGWMPPFIGSVIFRSMQFTVYEIVHTKMDSNPSMKETIPFSGGIEWRVFYGGFTAGTVRSLLECPFEYAKVKR